MEIKGDGCTVTIYRRARVKDGKEGPVTYLEYTLSYYQDGQRKLQTSSDLDALRKRADEVLGDLKEGRPVDTSALSAGQRSDYATAVSVLAPTGQSLIVAARHFAKAVEILGSDLVVLAAEEYARRHRQIEPRTVSETVKEFLAEKGRQNKSARHLETLTSHLERFADSMAMSIGGVTSGEINLFLDSLKAGDPPVTVSARTRDNYANSITSLFAWAKVKRYLPADNHEAGRIARLDNGEDGPIEIYSPEELSALLGASDAKLRPFLAIGAFAGLRSSEIMRLDWSDIRINGEGSCIIVQRGKVKTRGKSRRIVPMSDNLKAWLLRHENKAGRVWPYSKPYLYEMLREMTPKAQALLRKEKPEASLSWKANALRHSCISYRVASVKNVPQVALESGNSPQMIDSNYRELVTDQDAARWFAILPKSDSSAKA